ncbi:Protein of unknown function [Gryllus bimaculatus]|nr:Protein of unknown function [Gryllus bimaculatus]
MFSIDVSCPEETWDSLGVIYPTTSLEVVLESEDKGDRTEDILKSSQLSPISYPPPTPIVGSRSGSGMKRKKRPTKNEPGPFNDVTHNRTLKFRGNDSPKNTEFKY